MVYPGENVQYYKQVPWRLAYFDEDPTDQTRNVIEVKWERRTYADAALTLREGLQPIRAEVPVTAVDEPGMPAGAKIDIGTTGIRSPQAAAYNLGSHIVARRSQLDGVEVQNLTLRDMLWILAGFTDAMLDCRNAARVARWQLENEQINQAEYDAIIAGLVPTR